MAGFHVFVASAPPPDSDAWVVTGGPGSIGYWDDEFVVITVPEQPAPEGARPLAATVRPLSPERPTATGVVALRDFEVSTPDVDEFVDLSAGAWDSFEGAFDGAPTSPDRRPASSWSRATPHWTSGSSPAPRCRPGPVSWPKPGAGSGAGGRSPGGRGCESAPSCRGGDPGRSLAISIGEVGWASRRLRSGRWSVVPGWSAIPRTPAST